MPIPTPSAPIRFNLLFGGLFPFECSAAYTDAEKPMRGHRRNNLIVPPRLNLRLISTTIFRPDILSRQMTPAADWDYNSRTDAMAQGMTTSLAVVQFRFDSSLRFGFSVFKVWGRARRELSKYVMRRRAWPSSSQRGNHRFRLESFSVGLKSPAQCLG